MELKIDENLNVKVLLNTPNKTIIKPEAVATTTSDSTTSVSGGTDVGGDAYGEVPIDTAVTGVKDPLLSSWIFVIGITAVTLAISVTVGILLAKRRIKKGIELYED